MTGIEFLKKSVKIAAVTGAFCMLLCTILPNSLLQYSYQDNSVWLKILSPFYGAIFSVASILVLGGFYAVFLFTMFGLISVLGGLAMLNENLFGGVVGIILGAILLISVKTFTITLLTRLRTLFPMQYPRYAMILSTFPLISTFYFWYLVKINSAEYG